MCLTYLSSSVVFACSREFEKSQLAKTMSRTAAAAQRKCMGPSALCCVRKALQLENSCKHLRQRQELQLSLDVTLFFKGKIAIALKKIFPCLLTSVLDLDCFWYRRVSLSVGLFWSACTCWSPRELCWCVSSRHLYIFDTLIL